MTASGTTSNGFLRPEQTGSVGNTRAEHGRAFSRLARPAAAIERDVDAEPPDDDWVEGTVFLGEELPDEVYFDVIVAAIDEAHGDDDVLWCIADGPVDHLVGRDLAMGERLRERRGDPNGDRMFTTMQHYLRGIGYLDGSWWADDFVPRPRRRPGR